MHRRPPYLLAAAAILAGVLPATAGAQAPTTTRASLSSAGAQGNGPSYSATVSANGRWVAFASDAANLVAGDTNTRTDVFLRDRLSGETRRISVGPGGTQNPSSSDLSVMSADGGTVVFRSKGSTLVPGSPVEDALFVYDRVADRVRRIAPQPPYMFVDTPSISADGARIAFLTLGPAGSAIFTAETASGLLRRVSEAPDGTAANGTLAFDPNISADGRWVAFTTDATNLAPPDMNGYRDVVVRDLVTGAFTRISVGAGNVEANAHSSTPALSRDGCVAAFFSSASNLVAADGGLQPKVFVRDRCAGNTEVASVSNAGVNGTASTPIDISDDGCAVVFGATAIAGPPPSSGPAAVLRDRCTGATSRLDLSSAGDPGTGGVFGISLSGGTGRYAVFATGSTGLVPGDTNGAADVFVRDRATNVPPVARLSVTQDGSRIVADASASSDPDGPTVTGRFAFGDGSPEQAGLSAVHDYARGGVYGVGVTVTDADGRTATQTVAVSVPEPGAASGTAGPPPGGTQGGGPGAGPPSGQPARLRLDAVRLSRTRWSVVRRGARPGGSRGSVLRARLSAAATLTLRFERRLTGHRIGGRCARTRRRGKRCTLYSAAGRLTRRLPAGSSQITLTGRFGSRSLPRGRYRLRVGARSADGRTAPTRTLSFTVVSARRS